MGRILRIDMMANVLEQATTGQLSIEKMRREVDGLYKKSRQMGDDRWRMTVGR